MRYKAPDIFVASGVIRTPIADYPATVKHREHVTLVRLQITSLYDWHKELWCACMWDHDVSNGEQSQKLAVWGNTLAALGRLRWYGTAYQRPFDACLAFTCFLWTTRRIQRAGGRMRLDRAPSGYLSVDGRVEEKFGCRVMQCSFTGPIRSRGALESYAGSR
jgi:hypothetical protein